MAGLLEARGISLRRGGVRTLEEVSFSVDEWEIVGLIGPNGAGKTTLLDCISGFLRQDSGVVLFRGQDLTGLPAHRRVAMGITRTMETGTAFPGLTVLENMLTAQHAHVPYSAISGIVGSPITFTEERELRRNATEILEFLGLLDHVRDPVERVPPSTRKLCDLAMALATDPQVLLLDEPSLGMGAEEAQRLGEILASLRETFNLTIVVVESHLGGVADVCDYAYAMTGGRVVAHGTTSHLAGQPEVATTYLEEESDGASRG